MENNERGIVLISTLFLMTTLAALVAAHFIMTRTGLKMSHSAKASNVAFFSAEAGLNKRADLIRSEFLGYNVPSGTSPSSTDPCDTGNTGAGDMACISYSINNRSVDTYVEDITGGTPTVLTIPPGDPFAGLYTLEYRYDVRALSKNALDRTEAILGLRMKSRQIPVFQFMAFYANDLEIYNAHTLELNGPVHSNASIFLSTIVALNMTGPVSAVNDIYMGQKYKNGCQNGTVSIMDPNNLLAGTNCGSNTVILSDTDIAAWNGNVDNDIDGITLPSVTEIEMGPDTGDTTPYWDNADVRLVLVLDGSNNFSAFEIREVDGTADAAKTATLNGSCAGAATYTDGFTDWQRGAGSSGTKINTLDIKMQELLNCMHNNNWVTGGLDKTDLGGLVLYFGVDGPDKLGTNTYGVRIGNAGELASNVPGAPRPKGLTAVTSQAFYLWGDYNATNKIPSAVLGDRANALSNAWTDAAGVSSAKSDRVAASTTYQLGVIGGLPTTGGDNAPNGMFGGGGTKNGGLQNYWLRHEAWKNYDFTFTGSFVTFGEPVKATHNADFSYTNAPDRVFSFDTDFFEYDNLPPMTPTFVYIRQELFTRFFEEE